MTSWPPNAASTLSSSDVVLSLSQWVIFVVGTAGNLVVLLVLCWRRSPNQRVTQLFVVSLSVADLGMTLGGGWVHAILYVNSDWKFGRPFCKVQYSFQVLMINCSIWTLAALAMDRSVIALVGRAGMDPL